MNRNSARERRLIEIIKGFHFCTKRPPRCSLRQEVEQTEAQLAGEATVEACSVCGGDGKETCDNPDHGLMAAMDGETWRLGCPVCGHDPYHKVPGGGKCDHCDGTGEEPPSPTNACIRAAKRVIAALNMPEGAGVFWTGSGWQWSYIRPGVAGPLGGQDWYRVGLYGNIPDTAIPPWPGDFRGSFITSDTPEIE